MHLFTDYIHPLTLWLHAHPQLALLITFVISFTESLAIIGSIIPGSVTMTAIGILAGSGIMRIDLTFLAAALGAIAGDTGSYALGYAFSDRLTNVWPFKRYPSWLVYGKDFFARHGATSVLVGRFVGPMRSIIPVIAGMMHMNHWHFLLANIISAIGWSILYVLPGVLIGVASSELSPESATRLFVLILVLLVVVWLSSLGVKWLVIHTNQFLGNALHNFWTYLKKHSLLAKYAEGLAPKGEVNHYPTAALIILFLCCFLVSTITIVVVMGGEWASSINNAAYLFLQSLRTQSFDAFFVIVSLFISPLSLLTLILAFSLYTIYYRDWRTLGYWLSTSLMTSFIIFIMEPNSHFLYHTLSFPAIDLTLATSLFGFLILYISTFYRTITMLILRVALIITLLLAGIATIYLGDKWFTSVVASYFIGLTVCLFHWIFYRRQAPPHKRSQFLIALSCLFLVLATSLSAVFSFKELIRTHSTHVEQYVMTDEVWWNQQQPLLPIYSTNRIGRRVGLLNVQYAGSINKLVQALEAYGWRPQSNSFFYSLLLRAGGRISSDNIPLTTQIYLNRKPVLTMTYSTGKKEPLLILRLWRSNYHLRYYQEPIWVGSISCRLQSKKHSKQLPYKYISMHEYITRALPGFKFNKITLPKRYLKSLPYPTSRTLLTIKEPATHEDEKK